MRSLFILSVVYVAVSGACFPAHADDFGPRFYGQAPKALQPLPFMRSEEAVAMEDAAEELQNIMPAAGELEDTALDADSQDSSPLAE